jgi:hypothetical protein
MVTVPANRKRQGRRVAGRAEFGDLRDKKACALNDAGAVSRARRIQTDGKVARRTHLDMQAVRDDRQLVCFGASARRKAQ